MTHAPQPRPEPGSVHAPAISALPVWLDSLIRPIVSFRLSYLPVLMVYFAYGALGVIESKSNFIEHPELIAQRIGRYAKLVGRENVIAGSDCGFGTWVGQAAVDPQVVWAKMAAMAEGARIASREFWK